MTMNLRTDLPAATEAPVDETAALTAAACLFHGFSEPSRLAIVRHLAELGHKRIATITGLIETAPARDRLRGYREEIQRQGLAYRDDYVLYGDYYVDSGAANILKYHNGSAWVTVAGGAASQWNNGASSSINSPRCL